MARFSSQSKEHRKSRMKRKKKQGSDSTVRSRRSKQSSSESEEESSNSSGSSSSENDSTDSSSSSERIRRRYRSKTPTSTKRSISPSSTKVDKFRRKNTKFSSDTDSDSESSEKWVSRSRSRSSEKSSSDESFSKVRKTKRGKPLESGEVKTKYVKGWGFVTVKKKRNRRPNSTELNEFGLPKALDPNTIMKMVRHTEALKSTLLIKKKKPKSQRQQANKQVISLKSTKVKVSASKSGDGDEQTNQDAKVDKEDKPLPSLSHKVDADGFKMPLDPKVKKSGFVVVEKMQVNEKPNETNKDDGSEGTEVVANDNQEKTQVLAPKPKREKNYRRKTNDVQLLKQKREEYIDIVKRQAEKAHKMQELQEKLMSRYEKSQKNIAEADAKADKKMLEDQKVRKFPALHFPSMQQALVYGMTLPLLKPQVLPASSPAKSDIDTNSVAPQIAANTPPRGDLNGKAIPLNEPPNFRPPVLPLGPPPNRPPPIIVGSSNDEEIKGLDVEMLTNSVGMSGGTALLLNSKLPDKPPIFPKGLPPPSVVLNQKSAEQLPPVSSELTGEETEALKNMMSRLKSITANKQGMGPANEHPSISSTNIYTSHSSAQSTELTQPLITKPNHHENAIPTSNSSVRNNPSHHPRDILSQVQDSSTVVPKPYPQLLPQNKVPPVIFKGCYPPLSQATPSLLPYGAPFLQQVSQQQVNPSLSMWPMTSTPQIMQPIPLITNAPMVNVRYPNQYVTDYNRGQFLRNSPSDPKAHQSSEDLNKEVDKYLAERRLEGQVRSRIGRKKTSRKSEKEPRASSSEGRPQRDQSGRIPTPPPLTKLGLWVPSLKSDTPKPDISKRPNKIQRWKRINFKNIRSRSPKKRRLHSRSSPSSSESPPRVLFQRSSPRKAKTVSKAPISTNQYEDFSGGEEIDADGEISA